MTSTGINQGLLEGANPSSKVLQPPGGGSSISFGGEPEAPPQRQSQRGHVPPPQPRVSKAPFGESEPVEKILPQTRGSDSKNRIFGDDYCNDVVGPRRSSSSNTHNNIFGEGAAEVKNYKNGSPITSTDSTEFSEKERQAQIVRELYRDRINKLRRGVHNPITGEKYEKTACHQPPPKPVPTSNYQPLPSAADGPGTMQSIGGKAQEVRTSSRVLNPPGGPTTKLW